MLLVWGQLAQPTWAPKAPEAPEAPKAPEAPEAPQVAEAGVLVVTSQQASPTGASKQGSPLTPSPQSVVGERVPCPAPTILTWLSEVS